MTQPPPGSTHWQNLAQSLNGCCLPAGLAVLLRKVVGGMCSLEGAMLVTAVTEEQAVAP